MISPGPSQSWVSPRNLKELEKADLIVLLPLNLRDSREGFHVVLKRWQSNLDLLRFNKIPPWCSRFIHLGTLAYHQYNDEEQIKSVKATWCRKCALNYDTSRSVDGAINYTGTIQGRFYHSPIKEEQWLLWPSSCFGSCRRLFAYTNGSCWEVEPEKLERRDEAEKRSLGELVSNSQRWESEVKS